MAEMSLREKRKGLEFAKQLAELAATAPNGYAKKRTHQAANEMVREFGFSDADKRRWIAVFLEAGCSNYTDLSRETGFRERGVYEMVEVMAKNGDVEITNLAISTGGRPGVYIRLLVAKELVK